MRRDSCGRVEIVNKIKNMKKLLNTEIIMVTVMAIGAILYLTAADTREPNVRWLGSPITGEALGGGPAKGLLGQQQEGDVQIGLREDGVVVWRKR